SASRLNSVFGSRAARLFPKIAVCSFRFPVWFTSKKLFKFQDSRRERLLFEEEAGRLWISIVSIWRAKNYDEKKVPASAWRTAVLLTRELRELPVFVCGRPPQRLLPRVDQNPCPPPW